MWSPKQCYSHSSWHCFTSNEQYKDFFSFFSLSLQEFCDLFGPGTWDLRFWALPEKIQIVGPRTYFFKKTLEILGLWLYPWKIRTKQSFTPGNPGKLYYTIWKFQGQKNFRNLKNRNFNFEQYFWFSGSKLGPKLD